MRRFCSNRRFYTSFSASDILSKAKKYVFRFRVVKTSFKPIEAPVGKRWSDFFPSMLNHCMIRSNSRNYFNDIHFTSWPFYLGSCCFVLFFYVIVFLKKFANMTPFYLLSALLLFIFFLINWFDDLIYESRMNGRYNRKIRSSLVCGFLCFLISEVLLFGGFFWGFFDRFFNPGYILGSVCIPAGTENIDYMRWPLVGTFVLVTSGYFANNSYYFLRAGSLTHSIVFGMATLALAVFFLFIQYMEYNGLSLTISDNVFGSYFYLLTGFHGFHVTVGLLFLCEQYSRLMIPFYTHRLWRVYRVNYLYNRDRHLGLAFALIYWHFVDIIWLFLFFNVYVFENTNLGYWSSYNWVFEYFNAPESWKVFSYYNYDYEYFFFGTNGFYHSYRVATASF